MEEAEISKIKGLVLSQLFKPAPKAEKKKQNLLQSKKWKKLNLKKRK